MTIRTDGPVIPERLAVACADLLRRNGIEPFGDRSVHWLMPPELIEQYMTPEIENRLFGYPVHMEALLGESTILLVETLGAVQVEP